MAVGDLSRRAMVVRGMTEGRGGPRRSRSGVYGMKSRENLVRLKQFQVNEKRRQLLQLDMMIAEFERMANELDVQIAAEEKKAGISAEVAKDL